MHDPMVVAFEIRRPWPKHVNWTNRSWYFPAVVTVWHVDPGGYDSFDKCKRDSHWQWHIHHWKIQVRPLQALRRRLLTRCEWCRGGSRKRDVVNFSHSWDGPKNRWWRGEKGLYHQDCSTIESAYRTCTCPDPLLDHEGYGQCALCSRFRGWGAKPEWLTRAERVRAEIPEHTRDIAAYRLIFPAAASVGLVDQP